MKTTNLFLFAATLIFTACNKNDSNQNPSTSDAYINTNAGSTWTYHEDNSSGATSTDYTVTSTSRDSTIEGKKYHVYHYSYGGYQFLMSSGNEYYQYDSIPVSGGKNIARLYLKGDAAAGATWSQDLSLDIPNSPVPVPLHIDNKIVEKGISRTVNGTEYKNVTHVSTTLSSILIPSANFSSTLDAYYAPNYGLIENTSVVHLDFSGLTEDLNVVTKLKSADLK